MDPLLAAIEKNRWTVTFNHRADKWTVQKACQIVGNIGEARDLTEAIIQAMRHHNDELEKAMKGPPA